MSSVGNGSPVGVYTPAAGDAQNNYVQAEVTYIPAPATFVGNLVVVPSTATTPSLVFINSALVSDYPWSKYNSPGTSLAYFIEPQFSG